MIMSAESLRMPLFTKASLTRNMLSVSSLAEEDAALQTEDDWEDVEQMVVELESVPVVLTVWWTTPELSKKDTTTTHFAWHSSNVCSTLDIKLKGGKQKALNLDQSKVKASTAIASGSGLQETYDINCAFTLEAKRSTSHPPRFLIILWKTPSSDRHSISCLSTRDSKFASMLVDPGIWTADTKSCLSKHHNQMSLVMSLQTGLVLPLLFIHATVVLLSDWSCICELNFSLHNDCKANKAALSSRQLIWSEVSSAVHIPPVVVPRHSAPHPIFEAPDFTIT